MTKSSNVKQQGVKRFTPKQREKLLEILEPLDLKNVITDGDKRLPRLGNKVVAGVAVARRGGRTLRKMA